MPELDPDLVTWLTLGLLGLIVICLLGVMSSIGRVRKAIERAASQREREREDRWQAASTGAAAPIAAAAEPEPAIERRPEPVVAKEPEPESQTHSVEEPAAATASDGGPGVVAAAGASTGSGESFSSQSSEPAASEPAAASASTSSTVQTTQEPQEQPFERDGRWWFRRGSELLVYDEGTGQWVAAPDPANRPAPAVTQPIPTTISSVAGTGEHSAESSGGEQHGFWKCPSCGAVNGSTATSCRMCFTARP
jgi:cell pole-organizing protein PopZ